MSVFDESEVSIRPASTAQQSAKLNLLSPDSFKNSKSTSPSCDSPLSAEKEKSKRSKSSSKEKAESVKPERTSSGGKKVNSVRHLNSDALSPDLFVQCMTFKT